MPGYPHHFQTFANEEELFGIIFGNYKPFRDLQAYSAWKVFKYGVFSGPYFPEFGPEKTPHLDTLPAVFPLHLKLRFFDSLFLSIHLYSAESRSLVTIIKNHLKSFATSCYRVMLNIKRTDRIRNDRILDTCNIRNLLTERQIYW